MKTATLDIILVSYNNVCEAEKTVGELESLGFCESPAVNIQLIDSSDGDSQLRIKSLADAKNINYQWAKPTGIYPAMNLGTDITENDWLWFLNPGDSPYLSCLELLQILEIENVTLNAAIVFKTKTLSVEGEYIRTRNRQIELPGSLPFKFHFCHQGIIYSRSIFDCGMQYRTDFKLISDKILNDQVINLQTPIYDVTLACFFVGGRSAAKFSIRKELFKYIWFHILSVTSNLPMKIFEGK